MWTGVTASWREHAKQQVEHLRKLAADAWEAGLAARDSEPRAASDLMLQAHNLEVTANGIARHLEGGVRIAS